MKFLRYFLILFVVFFIECKIGDVDGSARIYVMHNGAAAANVTVYIKHGTMTDPNVPLSSYDGNDFTNSTGAVSFPGLAEGDHFFYAKTIIGVDTVIGTTYVSVVRKPSPNRYEKTIQLN